MRKSSTSREQQKAERRRSRHKRYPFWLGLAVLLAYFSAIPADWVWTDRSDILAGENRVQALNDLPLLFSMPENEFRARDSELPTDPGTNWRPLLALSYSLDWALWRDCTTCYHIENIVLHFVVVLGLYFFGRKLLERRHHHKTIAFWAALIFAIHPIGVTSVTWISGRAELLTALFIVWSLIWFSELRVSRRSSEQTQAQTVLLVAGLVLLAFFASLASAMAILLPMFFALVSWFELRERGLQNPRLITQERLVALSLVSFICLLFLVYRLAFIGGLASGGDYPSDSVLNNWGTSFQLFWQYAGIGFFPSEPALSDAWTISDGIGGSEIIAIIAMLALVFATALGIWHHLPIALAAAWFVLWITPSLGLFPLRHPYYEPALYPAYWGIFFGLSFLVGRLWSPAAKELPRGGEIIIGLPLIFTLLLITGLSNLRWWDETELFQVETEQDPAFRAGKQFLAEQAYAAGDYEKSARSILAALGAAERATEAAFWRPYSAYFLLAANQFQQGWLDEARFRVDDAIKLYSQDPKAWTLLGDIMRSNKQPEQAIEPYEKALDLNPKLVKTRLKLAKAYIDSSKFDPASKLLESLIDENPRQSEPYFLLAQARIGQKRFDKARSFLETGLKIKDLAEQRALLAWCYWHLGDSLKAREQLTLAQKKNSLDTTLQWVSEAIEREPAGPGL